MSQRPPWPADRAAARRVRSAMLANRPVVEADQDTAGQLLARLCWSTPTMALVSVGSLLFLLPLARVAESGSWSRAGALVPVALGLVMFGFCMAALRQQLSLRRWRRDHLHPPAH